MLCHRTLVERCVDGQPASAPGAAGYGVGNPPSLSELQRGKGRKLDESESDDYRAVAIANSRFSGQRVRVPGVPAFKWGEAANTGHDRGGRSAAASGHTLDQHNTRTISWPADEPLAGSFQKIEDAQGGR